MEPTAEPNGTGIEPSPSQYDLDAAIRAARISIGEPQEEHAEMLHKNSSRPPTQRGAGQIAGAAQSSGGASKVSRVLAELSFSWRSRRNLARREDYALDYLAPSRRERRKRLERVLMLLLIVLLVSSHVLLEYVELLTLGPRPYSGSFPGTVAVWVWGATAVVVHVVTMVLLYGLLWVLRVGPVWLRLRMATSGRQSDAADADFSGPRLLPATATRPHLRHDTAAEREAQVLLRQMERQVEAKRGRAQLGGPAAPTPLSCSRKPSMASDTARVGVEPAAGRQRRDYSLRGLVDGSSAGCGSVLSPPACRQQPSASAGLMSGPVRPDRTNESDAESVPLGIMARIYGGDAGGAVPHAHFRRRISSNPLQLSRLAEPSPTASPDGQELARHASRLGRGSGARTSHGRREDEQQGERARAADGAPSTPQLTLARSSEGARAPAGGALARGLDWAEEHVQLDLLRGAWQLSRVLRTLMMCVLWLNATAYLTRDRPCERTGFSTLAFECTTPWDLSAVPPVHYDLEALFLWLLTLEFSVELVLAREKVRFLLSYEAIVDLLAMPVLKLAFFVVARPFFDANVQTFLFQFGWLRFPRLYGLQPILLEAFGNSLSVAKLRALSIGLGLLSLNLTFAGAIYNEEAPAIGTGFPERWSGYFAYVYYAWVTMSTLGYGDFAPTVATSRALTIIVIILIVSWVPRQFGALSAALDEDRLNYGPLPAPTDPPHILLCGPITEEQLRLFLETFAEQGGAHDERTRVVVLTPLPAEAYGPDWLVRTLNLGRGKLSVRQGDVTSARTEDLVQAIVNAKAVFVASDVSLHALREHADLETVTRCLGVRKFMQDAEHAKHEEGRGPAGRGAHAAAALPNVFVQSHFTTHRLVLTGMGVAHQIYLSPLKMRLLGRAATTCQGCATLVSVLLYAPKREGNNDANDALGAQHKWRALYHRGLDFQIYNVTLPMACNGYTFAEVALALYRLFNIVLVAVVAKGSGGPVRITQRSRRIAGGRTNGFIIGPSRRAIEAHMRMLDAVGMPAPPLEFAPPVESSCGASALAAPTLAAPALAAPVPSRQPSKAAPAEGNKSHTAATPGMRSRQQVVVSDMRPWLSARARRVAEVWRELRHSASERAGGYEPALASSPGVAHSPGPPSALSASPSSAEPPLAPPHAAGPPHILISGWTRDMHVLLDSIFSSEPTASVAVLATHVPDPEAACATLGAWPRAFLVRGSVHSTTDVLRAGLLEATAVLLLSTQQADAPAQALAALHGGGGDAAKRASNGLLPVDAVQALAVTKVTILRLRAELERSAHAAALRANGPGGAPPPPPPLPLRVLTEVVETGAIPFVDRSGWWPVESDSRLHLDSPAFAAGSILSDSMCFPLLCQLYFVPQLQQLLDALLVPADGHAFLQLVEPAPELVGRTFGEAFEALLGFGRTPDGGALDDGSSHAGCAHADADAAGRFDDRPWPGVGGRPAPAQEAIDGGMLAVGIYKRRTARHAYVYLAPRLDDRLEQGDKVYVICTRQTAAHAEQLEAALDEFDASAEAQQQLEPNDAHPARGAARDHGRGAHAEAGASEAALLREEVHALRAEVQALTAALAAGARPRSDGGAFGAVPS